MIVLHAWTECSIYEEGRLLDSTSRKFNFRAVVVAQLVERSLPIPEVRGSSPVIGKNLYIEHLFTVNCVLKRRK